MKNSKFLKVASIVIAFIFSITTYKQVSCSPFNEKTDTSKFIELAWDVVQKAPFSGIPIAWSEKGIIFFPRTSEETDFLLNDISYYKEIYPNSKAKYGVLPIPHYETDSNGNEILTQIDYIDKNFSPVVIQNVTNNTWLLLNPEDNGYLSITDSYGKLIEKMRKKDADKLMSPTSKNLKKSLYGLFLTHKFSNQEAMGNLRDESSWKSPGNIIGLSIIGIAVLVAVILFIIKKSNEGRNTKKRTEEFNKQMGSDSSKTNSDTSSHQSSDTAPSGGK